LPVVPLVTALPASPFDGQEVILTDSLTAPTYTWRFRYVAAAPSNKWVFVGGAPGYAEVLTAQAMSSTTFAALATDGPAVTLPVAGDYLVEIGYRIAAATAVTFSFMSFAIGATPASDVDAAHCEISTGATGRFSVARAIRKTGLPATTLTAKYRLSSVANTTFDNRWMKATPVAVGG
jgi:hypothetical protein